MERRGGSGLPLGNTPAIPRSCGGPGDGIGGKFPLQQGQFWAPNTKENGGNLPLLSFLDKGNFDVGAQNPGFLSALFGVNSPTTGPILEGPRGRTAGSKIQDLTDTGFWRVLANLSDDADFRTDPTLHARIPRMTYVQATPSN